MPLIMIFSGAYCKADSIVDKLRQTKGSTLITDKDLVSRAASLASMPVSKIERALSARTSVFNQFTHEKERASAFFKVAVAEAIADDRLILEGFGGQLIPWRVTHCLRVCLIADMKFRINEAMARAGVAEKEAVKLIHSRDEDAAAWSLKYHGSKDPWNASHHDIILPTDKIGVDEASAIILENAAKKVLQPTPASRQAVADFLLAARVDAALSVQGHQVDVQASEGMVTLTINKHVLLLNRLSDELKEIVMQVSGVSGVETRVGQGYYQSDIYRRVDFQTPSKVLLVDDEREFVQTLSERLLMRDVGSAVAYDGESALQMISQDEPEVMILDLKMPGIDGIEVLRRVKSTNPEIEVIILTGHGSEADREICMDLGAFAYLQKPVDIQLLSETLKLANEKIRKRRNS
jgi:two-component system, OmpR family, response regulator CpxR